MTASFRFGTAGIRAPLGEGEGQLNLSSVRCIASAILGQLEDAADDVRMRGLCVGFDGRTYSREFADAICALALSRGFRVRVFDDVAPTPLLAFCTRLHAAAAGIMITASHNPAADNGIKLYLAGGRQVGAPDDREIEARLAREPVARQALTVDLAEARKELRLLSLGDPEMRAYLDALCCLVPSRPELSLPKLAYTATCGVGTPVTRALFQRLGASEVVEVAEQALPRADFGGLESPNPESPLALQQLFALAARESAEVAFAHDPDADRLAVVVRAADGALRSLSGDEMGALLGDFLLEQHPRPQRTLLVSSVVSGGLLERIAQARGAAYLRTPTGFKWIAARGHAHAVREQLLLLFGYEEALGYAFFAMADDKDGIAALYVTCELVRRLRARGETLEDRLNALSRRHGLFVTRQLSLSALDDAGRSRIGSVMQRLRVLDPSSLLGTGAIFEDHETGPEPQPLLIFSDAEGTRVCVRPSGTEPKLKLYLHARAEVHDEETVADARQRALQRLEPVAQQLRELVR